MADTDHNVVLLRHTLPDGSNHIDCFIDDLPESESGLLSIKMPTDPRDLCDDQTITGRLIGRHRRHYLNYEGPVGPGANGEARGHVKQVAQGLLLSKEVGHQQMLFKLQWLAPLGFVQVLCLTEHSDGMVKIVLSAP
ncbi:MAG: hypothetical protein P8J86_05590 [Phycisphaerales bacterium]|nr:hypothetical protein [Phycisphaerales bacterium]